MSTVFDVAKYVLEKKVSMSTWKLQKLCYYAQAWSLAWTGEPLFDEDFQAWANGPVCPELYYQHRGKFIISVDMLHKGDSSLLNDDQKDTIDVVLREYGDMEPYALRELTHHEAPWIDARHGLPEGVISTALISKEAMGAFYGGL